MKITVVGAGYVGLSLAVMLARFHDVRILDIDKERVDTVNSGICPFSDAEISRRLESGEIRVRATANDEEAYQDADWVIIAVPTDYDDEKRQFNTDAVDSVLKRIYTTASDVRVVLKSTVPVGYTKHAAQKYPDLNIVFSPEFLREGKALEDNLRPSRIIAGIPEDTDRYLIAAREFAEMLKNAAEDQDTEVMIMSSSEAETVKLAANTYLALRVSFFNELDTFAELKGLDTERIIRGICADGRIGNYYNNPSFGYGGYCLPKDTKQFLSEYEGIPGQLVEATVRSNDMRKDHIAEMIASKCSGTVGIYRMVMKSSSDNFRHSSILGIIGQLHEKGIRTLIYEPLLNEDTYCGSEVIHVIEEFLERSDLIVANRVSDELKPVMDKVYSRDLFHKD